MQQRAVGRSGLRVSRLALGTMSWGRDTDAEEAAAQLATFTEAGGTLVDTADVYAGGESERLLGKLLGQVVPRERVVLATKAVAHRDDGPFGGGASRGALLTALEGSLRRLRSERVDLWQLNAWDPAVSLEETLCAVEDAVRSGKVRYAGVSNYAGWQLATAATLQRGRTPLGSVQMEYSLGGAGRLAASGELPGASPQRAHRADRAGGAHRGRRSGHSPLAVAFAWVRDRPGVAAPVVGARSAAQLRGSLAAEELELPAEIRAALDDVSGAQEC